MEAKLYSVIINKSHDTPKTDFVLYSIKKNLFTPLLITWLIEKVINSAKNPKSSHVEKNNIVLLSLTLATLPIHNSQVFTLRLT